MSKSLGLRGLIWDKTPESWKKIILEKRVKNDFIDSVYAAIPKRKRGNNWKIGRNWLRCYGILEYKYQLTFTVAQNSKKPKTFWQKVIEEIELYENSCR